MNEEIDCFEKLRLLKAHKCNVENCHRPCLHITKGTPDKFWCKFHMKQAIKEGRIIKTGYDISLFPLARFLFNIGLVK